MAFDRAVFSAAGRAFLRAFGGSLLVLAPGVLASPNLDGALVLATAAVIASVSAGVRALQVFVPKLSIGGKFGVVVDELLRVGVSAFIVVILGVLAAPDLATAKSLFVAGAVGVVSAILQAAQNFVAPTAAVVAGGETRPESTVKLG